MRLLQIDPADHVVQDIPFAHHIRDRYKQPDLMTYFNRLTGNWVAGKWIHRDKGLIQEICTLGPHPGEIGPKHLHKFEARTVKAPSTKEITEYLKSRVHHQYDEMNEWQEEWNDWKKVGRKQGFEDPIFKKGSLTE